jgi:hypothetical protein
MIQSDAENTSNANPMNHSSIEIIDSAELAKRLHLPESWVRDRVRVRSDDPLPHVKFGRYVG